MNSICAYPMYQMPELEHLIAAWWQGSRRHMLEQGLHVPEQLAQVDNHYPHWRDKHLLLSQTCGYPLTHDLQGQVQYVATQGYNTPYSSGPNYCSLVLVRKDEGATDINAMRQTRVAFNGLDSQSGYHALCKLIAPLVANAQGQAFFSKVIEAGSHRRSLAMVAQGQADLCAVDCVTYTLLQHHAPAVVADLRILTSTESTPGLPYITSLSRSPETLSKLRSGLMAAGQDPALESIRDGLHMGPVVVLQGQQPYQAILDLAQQASVLGYEQLI